jgi:hypothetical protein
VDDAATDGRGAADGDGAAVAPAVKRVVGLGVSAQAAATNAIAVVSAKVDRIRRTGARVIMVLSFAMSRAEPRQTALRSVRGR